MRWTDDGLEYEADPRQAEKLIESIGLSGDNVRSTVTPGFKCTWAQVDEEKDLEPHEHTHPTEATVPGVIISGLIGQTSNTLPTRYVVGCHHQPTRDRMRSIVCTDPWWVGSARYSNTLGNEHRHWNVIATQTGRGAQDPKVNQWRLLDVWRPPD